MQDQHNVLLRFPPEARGSSHRQTVEFEAILAAVTRQPVSDRAPRDRRYFDTAGVAECVPLENASLI
jgi:hypothetical protein